mgnify:CR=1 FL=1
MPRPPHSEEELLERCRHIAGLSLGELAARVDTPVPEDLRRHKGWVGQLIEKTLGATGTSLPQPDFPDLGVELKTLPVDGRGLPRESTYVCTVPLEEAGQRWERCWLRRKLQRVLWLPVESAPALPIAARRLGMPLLWSPTPEEEDALRRDWEELMDMVCLGELERISARHGEVLQIRPKAANAKALRTAIGPNGESVLTNPRGFYLRATFTAAILRRHYHLPGA